MDCPVLNSISKERSLYQLTFSGSIPSRLTALEKNSRDGFPITLASIPVAYCEREETTRVSTVQVIKSIAMVNWLLARLKAFA